MAHAEYRVVVRDLESQRIRSFVVEASGGEDAAMATIVADGVRENTAQYWSPSEILSVQPTEHEE